MLNLSKKAKPEQQLLQIPVSKIVTDGVFCGDDSDRYGIERLSESIKKYGIIMPLTVCKQKNGFYLLMSGYRRLLAAENIGLFEVPAVVCNTDIKTAAIFTAGERFRYPKVSPFFEAEQISRLIREYKMTKSEAAERLFISETALADKLSLLCFTEEERQRIISSGLGERHIKLLVALPPEHRKSALNTVIAEQLTPFETEELINGKRQKESEQPVRISGIGDERLFANSLSKITDVMKKSGFNVKTKKNESDTYTEYYVRIKKPSKQMSLF